MFLYRDPNIGNTAFISDVMWPKFDLENQQYLILEPNATVGENFAAESYAFWHEYIPSLLEEETDEEDETCTLDAPIPIWESIPPPESKIFQIESSDMVLGLINGTLVHVSDAIGPSEINVIRGIPYAKPPIGTLRFSPPSPVDPWDGTISGTDPAPSCPYAAALVDDVDWSEDCLTLDIAAVNGAEANSLPVIVFIMGVNFQDGGQIPSAEMLASGTNSVVVTFRYRVGAFGFLSTGDSSASGNYGLLDTIAVLKWVNNYIGSLGGNPDQVTLMGYGTGGSIVNIMLLSKQSDGLFHRAISLNEITFSRVLHTSRQIKTSPLTSTVQLGENVGCSYEDNEQLLKCLRNESVTASDILRASIASMTPILFFPVVDNNVLIDSIENLSRNASNFKAVDHLIGVTEDPGALRLMRFNEPEMMAMDSSCLTEDVWRKHLNSIVNGHLTDHGPITRTLAAEYLETLPSESDENPCPLLRRAVDFLNDLFFVIPTLNQANTYSKTGANVFLYKFTQIPKYRGPYSNNSPPWIGSSFGDDIQYLFGLPYSATSSPGCYGAEDRKTSLVFKKILRDFITSG